LWQICNLIFDFCLFRNLFYTIENGASFAYNYGHGPTTKEET